MRPYHCESPACKQDFTTFTRTYYLDSPDAPCPSCKLSGHMVLCETIHLIVPDRKGPMWAPETQKNYQFVCKEAQKNFVLYPPGHPRYPTFYSTVPKVVTCEQCLLEYGAKFINAERFILS